MMRLRHARALSSDATGQRAAATASTGSDAASEERFAPRLAAEDDVGIDPRGNARHRADSRTELGNADLRHDPRADAALRRLPQLRARLRAQLPGAPKPALRPDTAPSHRAPQAPQVPHRAPQGLERALAAPSSALASTPPAPSGLELATQGLGFTRREHSWSLTPGRDQPLLDGSFASLRLPELSALGRALIQLGADRGERPVFIDCETTGLASASQPFVIGLLWHEGTRLRSCQWVLGRVGGEGAMLADMLTTLRRLEPAPLLSFNGASFDLPLLRLRAQRHHIASPELDGPHLDLLHRARRMWRGHFPDCRLGTLERHVLGLERRGDLPSSEIPAAFWEALRGDLGPLEQVCDHNLADLLTLPAIAARLAQAISAPADLGAAMRAARHLQTMGLEDQARELLASWVEPALRPKPAQRPNQDEGAPGVARPRVAAFGQARGATPRSGRGEPTQAELMTAALELASLHRRAGERPRAAKLWRFAWTCDPRSPAAAEAWAKHLEHYEGDFAEALAVTRGSRLPCPKRLARLERRLHEHGEHPPTNTTRLAAQLATGTSSAPTRSAEPISAPSLPQRAPLERPAEIDPARAGEPRRPATPPPASRPQSFGAPLAKERPNSRVYRLYR
ncbi:ribonuclease H-like domain-containing protein [Pseudenhygromyxa sp. WMMC2535]|uniref:ribonuclease H-like domain-containing protein n=1 Tax=Pseudenhygromyxa sp. WMMC2535 TaxID=2712867 RepID=UPI0020D08962|nr:ribonuclease H-like domain-containing protein [Pseudenhygromyxa sp. WMMC2535]